MQGISHVHYRLKRLLCRAYEPALGIVLLAAGAATVMGQPQAAGRVSPGHPPEASAVAPAAMQAPWSARANAQCRSRQGDIANHAE